MIVDDHPVVRDGLTALFDRVAGLTTVALAADGVEAVRLFNLHQPDVTLMDLGMPVMDGIAATRQILSNAPGARIVVFTYRDREEDIYRAMQAGAQSYLLKRTPTKNLVEVIHAVHNGRRRLAPEIASKLADRYHKAELTKRESEVLREIAKGKRNEEIASAINLTVGTVKTHVSHILGKLEVADRTQAIIAAYKRGLIDL
jgi:two-component system, NarL family, response regulator